MDRTITVQILPVHIYCSNLMIFIGRIIVNSSVCIAAGSVDSDLILPFVQLTASSGLIHAPQNMENWLTLSDSDNPDREFIFVNATRTKRDAEDRSPGSPMAPMPLLYGFSFRSAENGLSVIRKTGTYNRSNETSGLETGDCSSILPPGCHRSSVPPAQTRS